MKRCPTCGQPVRERLTPTQERSLTRYAEEFPGFTFSGERDESDYIVSSYRGKSMIGNRSVKHVREMLDAMARM